MKMQRDGLVVAEHVQQKMGLLRVAVSVSSLPPLPALPPPLLPFLPPLSSTSFLCRLIRNYGTAVGVLPGDGGRIKRNHSPIYFSYQGAINKRLQLQAGGVQGSF